MDPRLELARIVGKVGYQVTKERLTRPKPTSLRDVPPSPEALTPAWLTAALCDGVPGAAVVGFDLGARNDGTSARRTVRVTYNDAGREAGLPEALFTKSAPTFLTRMVGAGVGLARVEAMFYALVRPELDIETPVTRYSAYDPVSHRQLLITDDVSVTRDAVFGSVLTRTLDRDQADQIIDLLATLHAQYWQAPLRRRYGSWLQDAYEVTVTLNVAIGAAARIASGFERARAVIPPSVYARRAEVHPALMRSQELNVSTGPQTFLHGDVHPGNWYVTGDGRMGVYDWQLAVRGGPARDLAYALATHLTVSQRREWEHDLLVRYVERLGERGVGDLPSEGELFFPTASRCVTRCSPGSRRSAGARCSRSINRTRSLSRTWIGSPRRSRTSERSSRSGEGGRVAAPTGPPVTRGWSRRPGAAGPRNGRHASRRPEVGGSDRRRGPASKRNPGSVEDHARLPATSAGGHLSSGT